jgi:hypothetical protein
MKKKRTQYTDIVFVMSQCDVLCFQFDTQHFASDQSTAPQTPPTFACNKNAIGGAHKLSLTPNKIKQSMKIS